MSNELEVVIVKQTERKKLIAFLDAIFRPKTPGAMYKEYTHMYRTENGMLKDNYAMYSPSHEFLAHIGLYPLDLRIGSKTVTCRGIGAVATHPSTRGKGYMTALLNHCIDEMTLRGVAMSILWGERLRYSHYGWETGGRVVSYSFTRRSLDIDRQSIKGLKVSKYNPKFNPKMEALHNTRQLRVLRQSEDYTKQFGQRIHLKTVYAENNTHSRGSAYINYRESKDSSNINVYDAAGDSMTVIQTLRWLFKKYKHVNSIVVKRQFTVHEDNRCFIDYAADWGVHSLGKVRINDLTAVLEGFIPQIEQRLRTAGFSSKVSVNFRIDNEITSLCYNGKNVVVTRKNIPGAETLTLTRCGAVRLVFNYTSTAHELCRYRISSQIYKFLSIIFPLDFYIASSDFV
ncbi:MAG: GNAT family N-acetyltransferase [Elusimicrobiota bacterium]